MEVSVRGWSGSGDVLWNRRGTSRRLHRGQGRMLRAVCELVAIRMDCRRKAGVRKGWLAMASKAESGKRGYVSHYAGPRTQDLTTPKDFFDRINRKYRFTLDGAATLHNNLLK